MKRLKVKPGFYLREDDQVVEIKLSPGIGLYEEYKNPWNETVYRWYYEDGEPISPGLWLIERIEK